MKLGYLTTFNEEELKLASSIGYDGLEVQTGSWPAEALQSTEGRKEAAKKAKDLAAKYGITVTAIAHYECGVKPAAERISAYKNIADFCAQMGVGAIATMSAGDPEKSLDENIPIFKETFKEVAKIIEDKGVKIAFENWSGLRSATPPIKSINFGYHPKAWEMMFDAVDSPALGLEFDPSHLVWQFVDYIAAVKLFGSRIHHVHLKDTEIMEGALSENGFFSGGWWRYRIPGYGVINWAEFISALKEVGFDGGVAIEHEDPVFAGERRVEGLKLGYNHLRPIIVTG